MRTIRNLSLAAGTASGIMHTVSAVKVDMQMQGDKPGVLGTDDLDDSEFHEMKAQQEREYDGNSADNRVSNFVGNHRGASSRDVSWLISDYFENEGGKYLSEFINNPRSRGNRMTELTKGIAVSSYPEEQYLKFLIQSKYPMLFAERDGDAHWNFNEYWLYDL